MGDDYRQLALYEKEIKAAAFPRERPGAVAGDGTRAARQTGSTAGACPEMATGRICTRNEVVMGNPERGGIEAEKLGLTVGGCSFRTGPVSKKQVSVGGEG